MRVQYIALDENGGPNVYSTISQSKTSAELPVRGEFVNIKNFASGYVVSRSWEISESRQITVTIGLGEFDGDSRDLRNLTVRPTYTGFKP